MLTQRAVKADEMLTLGIANRVVPADQLMDEAMKLANKIAKGPLNCYTMSKALMNKAHETTLEDLLKEETAMQAAARMNPNAEEGLGAFLEKEKGKLSINFEPASLGFKIWGYSPTRASELALSG